ncbi:YqhG family protein [Gorillibacterium sp. sgz5001074]|uniref:YqhG family protein n=1 Tax=Gorillibacterium sp. sgz5001074 TaxID=3446695 RepID=UPI003F667F76
MNRQTIERFVMRYLEATGCQLVEKGDGHVTVRLSPEADKDLMNRSYYWSFVERTGAAPEPMLFKFVFDPEAVHAKPNVPVGIPIRPAAAGVGSPSGTPASGAAAGGPPTGGPPAGAVPGGVMSGGAASAPAGDSILGRYFGVAPAAPVGRVPSDVMMFGSRRLDQLFGVVQNRGKFVRLFEELRPADRNPYASMGYSTWLCVNLKVEFICDMKRDELHSFGIHLGTGQIVERFFDRVRRKSMSPQLPSNIHLEPAPIPIGAAVEMVENYLEQKIKRYDHRWSEDAWRRLKEEWSRIDDYFGELLRTVEPDKKPEVLEQYKSREQEIDWQYRPRIHVSVINCGFFHLAEGLRTAIDANR